MASPPPPLEKGDFSGGTGEKSTPLSPQKYVTKLGVFVFKFWGLRGF